MLMNLHSNGIYEVSTDTSGDSTHTLIDAITEPPIIELQVEPRSTSGKRSNTKRVLQGGDLPGCASGGHFLASDADSAVQILKNQCAGGPTGGGEAGGNKDFYAIYGNVVAYFCNYSSKSNHCYQDEIAQAIQQVVSSYCGTYLPGWDIVLDRALEYGYNTPDSSFCGRGTSG
jgi:hypothetical protein